MFIVRFLLDFSVLCLEAYAPIGCELTGDTVQFGKSAWGEAKNATMMFVAFMLPCSSLLMGRSVTTGEKWDSLTRNWFVPFLKLEVRFCLLFR